MEQGVLLDSNTFYFKGQFYTIQYKTLSVCVYINKGCQIIIL